MYAVIDPINLKKLLSDSKDLSEMERQQVEAERRSDEFLAVRLRERDVRRIGRHLSVYEI